MAASPGGGMPPPQHMMLPRGFGPPASDFNEPIRFLGRGIRIYFYALPTQFIDICKRIFILDLCFPLGSLLTTLVGMFIYH